VDAVLLLDEKAKNSLRCIFADFVTYTSTLQKNTPQKTYRLRTFSNSRLNLHGKELHFQGVPPLKIQVSPLKIAPGFSRGKLVFSRG
jgi:hypothetical protein